MRKKKHKKKNKNMKKREIQKMQVENQQEVLGADVDKNQVENQQEILVDAAEKEQRRTTRLGAIIAIVAVIGTLCAFLFKMTISSLNVWSEQGVMYWYLQALFSFALSTSVIIFIDIPCLPDSLFLYLCVTIGTSDKGERHPWQKYIQKKN